jgi:hypothetical protein
MGTLSKSLQLLTAGEPTMLNMILRMKQLLAVVLVLDLAVDVGTLSV